jgi:hypothetical protein
MNQVRQKTSVRAHGRTQIQQHLQNSQGPKMVKMDSKGADEVTVKPEQI